MLSLAGVCKHISLKIEAKNHSMVSLEELKILDGSEATDKKPKNSSSFSLSLSQKKQNFKISTPGFGALLFSKWTMNNLKLWFYPNCKT